METNVTGAPKDSLKSFLNGVFLRIVLLSVAIIVLVALYGSFVKKLSFLAAQNASLEDSLLSLRMKVRKIESEYEISRSDYANLSYNVKTLNETISSTRLSQKDINYTRSLIFLGLIERSAYSDDGKLKSHIRAARLVSQFDKYIYDSLERIENVDNVSTKAELLSDYKILIRYLKPAKYKASNTLLNQIKEFCSRYIIIVKKSDDLMEVERLILAEDYVAAAKLLGKYQYVSESHKVISLTIGDRDRVNFEQFMLKLNNIILFNAVLDDVYGYILEKVNV